ncbi:MAG: hypothetical protein KGQ66_01665 [Acidobacteriota bacterium]|nr:hypothetical protein [Acidobacteriota bacterium]
MVAGSVCALACALRMVHIRTTYDIFIDEVTYTRLARNLATGRGVTLGGKPFDLHPPAVIGLFGLVAGLTSRVPQLLQTLLDLRYVTAAFGALCCVGAYLLVRRAAPELAALAAALILAVDPFTIHFDSRVLLEAPTQAATVASIGFLAGLVGAHPGRSRNVIVGASGLTAAVALCSKETFGLALAITILLVIATGWVVRRTVAAAVLAIAVMGWTVQVVATGLTSGFGPWWSAQTGGFARLIGTSQPTGFNSPHTHVSLTSRIFANASTEGSTYLLLVFGAVAALWVLIRTWRGRHQEWPGDDAARVEVLVATWTVGSLAYLGYATLFGTIEEQMYYICLLPCVAVLAVVIGRRWGSVSAALKAVTIIGLGCVLVFDVGVWTGLRTTTDNAYLRLLAWSAHGLPDGSVVAATDETSQFLLHHVTIGQWNTLPEFRDHGVAYVIVSTTLTDQGYGLASPALLSALQHRAPLAFSADDVTMGQLDVFDVRALDGVRS